MRTKMTGSRGDEVKDSMRYSFRHGFALVAALALGATIFSDPASASAGESAHCEDTGYAFDGTTPLRYAVVTGDSASKLRIYSLFPENCKGEVGPACRDTAYILSGDQVAVGKVCGNWAHIQYIGAKKITAGWVDLKSLKMSQTQEHGNFTFRMLRGHGVPVCEAYQQKLNLTNYADSPYCHWEPQKRNEATPGFYPLPRIPLGASELRQLIGPAIDFLWQQEIDPKKRRSYAPDGLLIDDPEYSLSSVQSLLTGVMSDPNKLGYHMKAWRYASGLDIQNDGRLLQIMGWQGDINQKTTCNASWSPENSALGRIKQALFVLDSGGLTIDAQKTRQTFGRTPGGTVGQAFQPLGDTLGIFKYRGAYYLESFLDEAEGAKKRDTARYKVLEVFQHINQKTIGMCEYSVDANKTAQ
jgi:hypothetical protein